MEISRKTFLHRVAAGAFGYALGAPLLSAFAEEAPKPGVKFVDGEQVLPAVPATKSELTGGGPTRFARNGGPGFGRRIAFTFDDGPHPKNTPRVLDILKERNITATFFMIGGNVAHFPDVAKKVAEAGHEIGNHSMTHPQLNRLPAEKVEWEIGQTQENIIQATGVTPVWFRPPYGAFRTDQGPIPAARGLGVVWWTVDPRDWAEPGIPKVTDAILKGTVPGSIILTHDIHKPTVDALPAILDELLARGFEFTNVSGFLGSPYGGPPGTVPPGITPAAPYPPAAIPGAPAAPAAVPAAPEAPVAEPVKA